MTIEEAVEIYNLSTERISKATQLSEELDQHFEKSESVKLTITRDKYYLLKSALFAYMTMSRKELQKVYIPTPLSEKTAIELTFENAIKEAGEFEEVYLPREDAELILTFIKENRINENHNT